MMFSPLNGINSTFPATFQAALSKTLLAHVGNHALLLREMIGEMIDG
jgi:hypothetical protein